LFKDAGNIAVWAREPIQSMYQAGLVSGSDTGEFKPLDNMTRQEGVATLYSLFVAFGR